MSREARHLRHALGKRVRCDLERDGRDVREFGTLVQLRASGPRVRFDDGRERTVAAWRIMRVDDEVTS